MIEDNVKRTESEAKEGGLNTYSAFGRSEDMTQFTVAKPEPVKPFDCSDFWAVQFLFFNFSIFFKIFQGSLFFPLSLNSQSFPRLLSSHWEWSRHLPFFFHQFWCWLSVLFAGFVAIMSYLLFSFCPRYYNPYRFFKTDVTPCVPLRGGEFLGYPSELVLICPRALLAAASNLSLHLPTALALIFSSNLLRSCGITSVNLIYYSCGLQHQRRYMFRSVFCLILPWESKTVHKRNHLHGNIFAPAWIHEGIMVKILPEKGIH